MAIFLITGNLIDSTQKFVYCRWYYLITGDLIGSTKKFVNYRWYYLITGDLIGSTQKFAEMIGWKTEMEELIVQNEGSFLVVSYSLDLTEVVTVFVKI